MTGPADEYARLDRTLRAIRGFAAVVAVLVLAAGAFVVLAAGHALGLGPSSDVQRRGVATIQSCRADAAQLGLMQSCIARVEWEPEAARPRKGMRDRAEVIVEARRPVSGRVAVESYEERWSTTTNNPDLEVIMVAGHHRRGGAGIAIVVVGAALLAPLVVAWAVSNLLALIAERGVRRRLEGEGSEPRGRRIA